MLSPTAGSILASIAKENTGADPLGSVGAVVAGNLASLDEDVVVNGPLLAPGFGAQGGTVSQVARLFWAVRRQVLPATSREVLGAGPDLRTLRETARRTAGEVSNALGYGS